MELLRGNLSGGSCISRSKGSGDGNYSKYIKKAGDKLDLHLPGLVAVLSVWQQYNCTVVNIFRFLTPGNSTAHAVASTMTQDPRQPRSLRARLAPQK